MFSKIISLVVLILLVITSCSDLIVNEQESNLNIRDFETVWQIVNRYYPFLEFKNINWDSLYTVYKPKAENTSGDEIYPVLYELLRELKDGHVEVQTKGGFPVMTYLWPRYINHKSFDQNVVARYLKTSLLLAGNNNISYGMINSVIGYIYFSTFKEGDWIQDFDEILEYFKNTKGLIIDVRNNGGGSGSTYDYVISRLIGEPVEEKWFLSDGQERSHIIQPGGSLRYSKPTVILINGASFSAAEIFSELMRQLPNVTLVGDTTGGGGGANEIFQLPSGKRIKIPTMYFARLDGKMVEWNGILPDVLVKQTESDIERRRDKQLEYAIQLLIESSSKG